MILELDIYLVVPAVLLCWFILPFFILFKLTPFKLIEQSSNGVKYTFRPIFNLLSASIIGGISSLFVLVLLFHNFFMSLDCNRVGAIKDRIPSLITNQIECNFTAKSLLLNKQTLSFIDPIKADYKIDIDPEDEYNFDYADISLFTTEQKIELPRTFSHIKTEEASLIVEEINNFIQNSKTDLKITQDELSFLPSVSWLTILFTTITILPLIFANYYEVSFDLSSAEFTLVKRSFFKHHILHTVTIEDIEKAVLKTSSGEESIVQSVFLHLKSGEKISIAGMANNYSYQPYLVKAINKLLKIYNKQQEQI